MIYVGIDDTDNLESPGTNQLARRLVSRVSGGFHCRLIVRHQLLVDPRVPYTSKNSSAALLFESKVDAESKADAEIEGLIDELRCGLQEHSAPGSDPGLCVVTGDVPQAVVEFGRRCQQQVVRQQDARELAARHAIHLEGLGGSEDGVIGALAAVGLASTGDDGRVVNIGNWPDDLAGPQPVGNLQHRGIEVRSLDDNVQITEGVADVGKHLRPNYRHGRVVLFVERAGTDDLWTAVRFT